MHRLLFTLRPFWWCQPVSIPLAGCQREHADSWLCHRYSSWGMQLFCLQIENTRKAEVLFILNQEPLTTTRKNSRPPEIPHCVCMMPGRQNILRGKLELYNMTWKDLKRDHLSKSFPFLYMRKLRLQRLSTQFCFLKKCFCAIFIFFPIIFISLRLITLQYCSGFCYTSTWISHGLICVCFCFIFLRNIVNTDIL